MKRITQTASCRRAVQQVMETFGALDILINCAGIGMSTAAGHRDEARIKFFEADPDGWQRCRRLEVSVLASEVIP